MKGVLGGCDIPLFLSYQSNRIGTKEMIAEEEYTKKELHIH